METIKKVLRFESWEYWPVWAVYLPVAPKYLVYVFKLRKWNFPGLANPSMPWGGLTGKEKHTPLSQIPNKTPKSILIHPKLETLQSIELKMQDKGITFPCVCKPNQGYRGKNISIVKTKKELNTYHKKIRDAFIIQSFSTLKQEYGVFYVRYPNEKKGSITSLSQREFFTVIGDGVSTLKKLIEFHSRGDRYKEHMFSLHEKDLHDVLQKGENKILEPIGNHSRGTIFRDVCDKITPTMEQSFDKIAKEIPGFYYGRFDVKANSLEDLENGNVEILELNGTNSEPIHMYNPGYSYWNALKEIDRHWAMMFEIAKENKYKNTNHKLQTKSK